MRWAPDYRYPYPDSYQVFYLVCIAALDPFDPTAESRARGLLPPREVLKTPWAGRNPELYRAALAATLIEVGGE